MTLFNLPPPLFYPCHPRYQCYPWFILLAAFFRVPSPGDPQPILRFETRVFMRPRVEILVNGEPRHVESNATIADLLDELKMQPRYLAVERNFELVPRAQHAACALCDGDRLEIVTLVGGG